MADTSRTGTVTTLDRRDMRELLRESEAQRERLAAFSLDLIRLVRESEEACAKAVAELNAIRKEMGDGHVAG